MFEETPRALPPAQAEASDSHQRGAGKDQAAQRGGPAHDHAPDAVPRRRRRGRICAARSTRLCRSASAGDRRSGYDDNRCFPIAAWTRSTRRFRACSRLGAVHHHLIREGTRTRAWPGRRVGRAARGDALLPAGRLWRGRGQSVSRVRDDGRDDPTTGILKDIDEETAVKNFNKAMGKSLIEDRLQDGHLDACRAIAARRFSRPSDLTRT